ncbi:MAG: hypothetical protein NBV68_10655 [Erythrobacter sp.]|nr:hypothetical protein [Erythrobacter sp.]
MAGFARPVAAQDQWELSEQPSTCSIFVADVVYAKARLTQLKGSANVWLVVYSTLLEQHPDQTPLTINFSNASAGLEQFKVNGAKLSENGVTVFIADFTGIQNSRFDEALHSASFMNVLVNGKHFAGFSLRGSGAALARLHACAGVTPPPLVQAAPPVARSPVPAPAPRKPATAPQFNPWGVLYDRINSDSQRWLANRYVYDSLGPLQSRQLADGHTRYWAEYEFDGFFGRQVGWIAMVAWGDEVDCIEYWDNRHC